jgi:hypothetical protein
MIIYKHWKDFAEDIDKAASFCQQHNIVYFKPSKEREQWLVKWLETVQLPVIETSPDIICYFRSYGTWGMYHPENNSISICPYKIDKAGGLLATIQHELIHLHHPEFEGLSHEIKEQFIQASDKSSKAD